MAAETVHEGTAMEPPIMAVNAPVAPKQTIEATGTDPASGGPTGRAWGALTGNPGATVAAIAMAAGVSKTAARKALIALEADGRATRSAGGHEGGKRAPDTWHPTPPAGDTGGDAAEAGTALPGAATGTEPDQDGTGGDPTDARAADQAAAPTAPDADEEDRGSDPQAPGADTTLVPEPPAPQDTAIEQAEPDTTETGEKAASVTEVTAANTRSGAATEEGMQEAAVAEALDALTLVGEAITCAKAALGAGDGSGALAAAEAIYAGSGKTRRLVRAAANRRARSASGRPKSQPGELRAKVAAHLAAHPGREFTPHDIGKALGHSAGAVANALDRLLALGQAVETCDRPRRFTAAPADDTTSTGATAEETPDGAATDDDAKVATR